MIATIQFENFRCHPYFHTTLNIGIQSNKQSFYEYEFECCILL